MTEQQELQELELVKLIAKAAGLKLSDYHPDYGAWDDVNGREWNPKLDDGDAFRLQVALRMAVTYPEDECFVRVWHGDIGNDPIYEPLGNNPQAATRLAVWRAALEIAKEMM